MVPVNASKHLPATILLINPYKLGYNPYNYGYNIYIYSYNINIYIYIFQHIYIYPLITGTALPRTDGRPHQTLALASSDQRHQMIPRPKGRRPVSSTWKPSLSMYVFTVNAVCVCM